MNEVRFSDLDVSRETMERLSAYVALIEKWNPKINLVGRTTISDIWSRHIVDSAQLLCLAPDYVERWLDMGSGGGMPGIVVAIIAKETGQIGTTTLIESDVRKATFLRTVIRELGLNATVIADRIEKTVPQLAEIVSARALAPLEHLIGLAHPHLAEDGSCLFLKGANWEAEVAAAQLRWSFSLQTYRSQTDCAAAVLKIGEIHCV